MAGRTALHTPSMKKVASPSGSKRLGIKKIIHIGLRMTAKIAASMMAAITGLNRFEKIEFIKLDDDAKPTSLESPR